MASALSSNCFGIALSGTRIISVNTSAAADAWRAASVSLEFFCANATVAVRHINNITPSAFVTLRCHEYFIQFSSSSNLGRENILHQQRTNRAHAHAARA